MDLLKREANRKKLSDKKLSEYVVVKKLRKNSLEIRFAKLLGIEKALNFRMFGSFRKKRCHTCINLE